MSKKNYCLEKLSSAIHLLAVHPENIKKRLALAGVDILIGVGQLNSEEEMSSEIIQISKRIEKSLTRLDPNGDEGRLDATSRRIRYDTASDIANDVVDLYNMLKSDD